MDAPPWTPGVSSMADAYNQKQIENMLELPNTTVRRYVRTFGKYLSTGARNKRRKTYNDDDWKKLEFIRDAYRSRTPKKDIEAQLKDGDFTAQPGSALAYLPEIRTALEAISTGYAALKEDTKNIAAAVHAITDEANAAADKIKLLSETQAKQQRLIILISAAGLLLALAVIYLLAFR